MFQIMSHSIPVAVSAQLAMARQVIERHLGSTLLAIHLYGSALEGGLKPYSDIDLLVTLAGPPDDNIRHALLLDLLAVSAPPGHCAALRALEVTVVVRHNVAPWHYPARRELQFGEWLRNDLIAGIFEPASFDPDLAILLTQARQCSIALTGPPAEQFFDPVPEVDLIKAMSGTLRLWNTPPDWAGDERNVVLTLARIWYSAATGEIVPKDVAADWAMVRLPCHLQPVLLEARAAYLGDGEDRLAERGNQLTELVQYMKGASGQLLDTEPYIFGINPDLPCA
jgi:streptomycin 3"-adenylyltransferase